MLVIFSVYLLLAFSSFFFTGAADQSIIDSGNPDLRDQPTADIVSMHTAQINERILIMIHKHKSEEYREPYNFR